MNLKSCLFFMLFITSSKVFATSSIDIHLENLENDNGKIYYSLFNQETGFPSDHSKSFKSGELTVLDYKKNGLVLNNLAPGKYALSLFHDENKNGKLDTSSLGIPKEAFGFSNNPTLLFGPPSFNRASFTLDNNYQVKIRLKIF